MADRRRDPQDDLVTALVPPARPTIACPTTSAVDDRGLLFAGYDTTRNQLGLAMWMFAEYRSSGSCSRRSGLAPRAVEEVMRFAAPSVSRRGWWRKTSNSTAISSRWTMLALSTSSANHDPATYEEPWVFDITAERETHFTFGGGRTTAWARVWLEPRCRRHCRSSSPRCRSSRSTANRRGGRRWDLRPGDAPDPVHPS